MRDIVVTLLVFGTLPFILRRAWFGIIVWTWLGFMNPHKLCWGFARELPFAYVVALTTLFGMLLSREPKKIPWTRESVTLALFILWMTVTTFFAVRPEFAWLQLEKVAKIQFMIFVAMMLITNRYRLHVLVWTIAVSIGFYGVKGGIFTIVHGGVFRVQGPEGTFFGGNNETGLALAMTIPLLYYLYRETRRAVVRWGVVAAIFLTSVAAIGTQSRGALLGMGTMAVLLWWKSRHKILMGLLAPGAAYFIYAFMPPEWFERMSTIKTYETDASAQGRLDAWAYAIDVATSRFFGGGFEMFKGRTDAHSIYFEVLGEHGYVGLGLFLLLGMFTWMAASHIRRKTEGTPDMDWMATLARMVQVSLVAYATAGAFLGMAYFDYAYNLVLIVVLCKAILARQRRKEQPAAVAGASVPRRIAPTASPANASLRRAS